MRGYIHGNDINFMILLSVMAPGVQPLKIAMRSQINCLRCWLSLRYCCGDMPTSLLNVL